ncbi:MAG: ABC transporter permease [Actinomycetia bacterium]|nr:ABC transporter permease [Actinomycetes bacterium]
MEFFTDLINAADRVFVAHWPLLLKGTIDTLLMVVFSTLGAYVLGIPLAVILKITRPGSLHPIPVVPVVIGWIVNMGRSIPYIILMIVLIPVTRAVVGSTLSIQGAIFPLIIGATPFVARMVETSFEELPPGRVEAALAFGASTMQVIWKVYLRESLPSLVRGAAISAITLIGYSAIAGALGNGGLGDVAIRYGYNRYQGDVMIVCIIILVIMVQVIQSVADLVARKIDKRI